MPRRTADGTLCPLVLAICASAALLGPPIIDADAPSRSDPAPLLTWRNLYDWPAGHGYAGWHIAASAPAGAFGLEGNLGNQYGLWIWPVGGQRYRPNYVEWVYTAPGTTRIKTAALDLAYANKLLAHHCLRIGLRVGTSIIDSSDNCKPVHPPDSQRQFHVSLADRADNPTAKQLYVRVEMPECRNGPCEKNIPALDPLKNGAFARLKRADMVLVDDDLPSLERVSSTVDGVRDLYTVAINATDPGSGIKNVQIAREGGGVFAAADAACDPTHRTPELDNRVCPERFPLTGTLDISGLEDGAYTFVATATDLAGHVATLRWTVTIGRISLDISLNPLSATPLDRHTTATITEFGIAAGTTVSIGAARQQYRWRFNLAADQRLVVLSTGGLAVVTDPAIELDPPPDDDYSDAELIDPGDPVDEPADEDPPGEEDDPGDLPPLPTDDDEAGTPRGALDTAEEALGDAVDTVATALLTQDAGGRPIPATFTVNGNIAVLTISHRGTTGTYPVAATADLLEHTTDAEAEADSAREFGAMAAFSLAEAVNCAGKPRPQIITYNPQGWIQLVETFKAVPTACADYYVVIQPPPANKAGVNDFGLRHVCAANDDGRVRNAGARLYPVAEFSWTAWRKYAEGLVATKAVDSITKAWRKAGRQFRVAMSSAGYRADSQCGADGPPVRQYWAINELPTTFTTRAFDDKKKRWIEPPEVWANVRAATYGLLYGNDDTRSDTHPQTPGIVFVANRGHDQAGFTAYRNGLKALTREGGLVWRPLARRIKFWGQEAYTNPFKSLLPKADGQAYNRAVRAQHVNAYTLHPVLLADKGGSVAASARAFYRTRYVPLLNGFWGAAAQELKEPDKYGHTDKVDINPMLGLVSLQLYATRRRATGSNGVAAETSTGDDRVPNRRIGFAWHDEACRLTPRRPDEPPDACDNPDFAKNQSLANRIAEALKSAYEPAGHALAACKPGVEDFCLRTVPPVTCSRATRIEPNRCWLANFSIRNWSDDTLNCPVKCP